MRRSLLFFAIATCILPIDDVAGRGRSFPIEVTGIMSTFDETKQSFTIQVDEPAKILTIAIGRDCKFKENGAPADDQILKKSASLKVSYFATIFTGNIAVEIEMNPRPELASGVIEKIEPADRRLTLRLSSSRHIVVRWSGNARFINRGSFIMPGKLEEGTPVSVSYYAPAFAAKYAVKIETQPVRYRVR